jgi:hypothetical protein
VANRLARSGLDASVAAKVILEALQDHNPPPRQVVGREAKVLAALARLLPYRVLYGLTARARAR